MAGTALAAAPEAPSIDGMKLSPAVRKLAREHNLDVSRIHGSGMGGRITREDVLAYIESGAATAVAAAPAQAPAPGRAPEAAPKPLKPIPAPSFLAGGGEDVERKPLTPVRKKIAENMVRAKHTAAHCATWDEVDMTALVELRGRMKERVKQEYGVSLTYMPFIMKAVVRALREYPILNASMTDTEVVMKKFYNIGMAVHRDQGLIVPNVKAADRKTLLQLAARDRESRNPSARRQAHARRHPGRHLHDHERRHVRRDRLDPDHQRARGRDPRRPPHPGARGGP